jgi:hypothetical protein
MRYANEYNSKVNVHSCYVVCTFPSTMHVHGKIRYLNCCQCRRGVGPKWTMCVPILGGDEKLVWRIGRLVSYRSKPKLLERNCPSATLSTTNLSWTTLGLNPGLYSISRFAFYRILRLVITSACAGCPRFRSRKGVTAVWWSSTLNYAATSSLCIISDYLFIELPIAGCYVMWFLERIIN